MGMQLLTEDSVKQAEGFTCLDWWRLLDAGCVHVVEAGKVQIRHQQRGQVIIDVPDVLEQVCCIDVLHTFLQLQPERMQVTARMILQPKLHKKEAQA